jgi:hypothetical protein
MSSEIEPPAGELKGGVLIYKTPDGEFVNVSLGSQEVESLREWFAAQRIKAAVDGGARGLI